MGFGQGTTTKYVGYDAIVFSFVVRIIQGIIDLSGRIHKESVRVLLDSGSTNNYISGRIIQAFNLIAKKEEGVEEVTLEDGAKIKA